LNVYGSLAINTLKDRELLEEKEGFNKEKFDYYATIIFKYCLEWIIIIINIILSLFLTYHLLKIIYKTKYIPLIKKRKHEKEIKEFQEKRKKKIAQ
jgi:hypothetical protein